MPLRRKIKLPEWLIAVGVGVGVGIYLLIVLASIVWP